MIPPSPPLRWPLAFIADAAHRSVGWGVIHAPLVSPSRLERFAELRRGGYRFIGMTSDGAFPASAADGPLDYGAVCEAWCHCFRDPDRYLPPGTPRALISHSDFTDPRRLWSELSHAAPIGDGAELVYVGATEPWKQEAKNWPLARRAIPRLCAELGIRALVVGAPCEEVAGFPGVTCVPQLPWRELLAAIASARLLFVPNEHDASPRVLAEALALDVPVLVNRRILGGWKYVNAFTGAFFDGDEDVVARARECLAGAKKPRRWFETNYGPYHAGRRLLALLAGIDPAIGETSHLVLTERLEGREA